VITHEIHVKASRTLKRTRTDEQRQAGGQRGTGRCQSLQPETCPLMNFKHFQPSRTTSGRPAAAFVLSQPLPCCYTRPKDGATEGSFFPLSAAFGFSIQSQQGLTETTTRQKTERPKS